MQDEKHVLFADEQGHMTYDPEFNTKIDDLIARAVAGTEELRSRYGDDHGLVKIFECYDEAFAYIRNLHDDYDNCFDPERKEEIAREITSCLRDLLELWSDFAKKVNALNEN